MTFTLLRHLSGANILKFMSLFDHTPTESDFQCNTLLPPFLGVPDFKINAAIEAGRKLAQKNFPECKPHQLGAVSFSP